MAKVSSLCGDDVDGGTAISGSVIYVPCARGVMAVRVNASNRTMKVLWKTPTGSSGPPIVAGGKVWTLKRSGILYGLKPSDGTALVKLRVGAPANHFATPSVGGGLLLATSSDQVIAFH